MRTFLLFLGVLVLAAAGIVSAWLIRDGFIEARTGDAFVSVKGVSEREVQADLALWPLSFVVIGEQLETVQSDIEAATARVYTFLERNGFEEAEIELQTLKVNDRLAQAYRSGPIDEGRFIATQTVTLRTPKVEAVAAANQRIGDLVGAGVILSSDFTGGPQPNAPVYIFSGLSDLKPEMIAEATANARRGAEQFAADSGAQVGAIRRANQGLFVIRPRDDVPGAQEAGQINKTVRVVSTIEYFLEN